MDSLRRVLRRIHDAKEERRLLKNLDFYIKFDGSRTDKNHLSLIQPETSGGSISNDTIDSIEQHPSVSEISISGLKQKHSNTLYPSTEIVSELSRSGNVLWSKT